MELRILRRVCQVGQNADDFLALGRFADFVQLVKVDDRVAGLAADENVRDFPPHTALVRVGMPLQAAAVGGATERNERKIAPQNLADAFLHQRRLSRAGGAVNGDRRADGSGIRNPLPHHLQDLHFGVVEAVDCGVQVGFGGGHELVAAFHAVGNRNGQIFVAVEGDLHESIHPGLQLAVLAAARFHVLQHANFPDSDRLHVARNVGFQQRQLVGLLNFGDFGNRVHFVNHGALLLDGEVLLEVLQIVGGAFPAQQLAELLGVFAFLRVRELVQFLLNFFFRFF